MPIDQKLRNSLRRALSVVDDHDTPGPRLFDDAQRLWRRAQRLLAMGLIPSASADLDALELACYAMHLPMRQSKALSIGKLGRTNLRDRAEQAAELLVSTLGDQIDESLLDRTTRLLHELPQRSPVTDEAKLLADAVNLEDFGATGLFQQAILLSRQGEGISQITEGAVKREQYGYWDARLKDGFHFEPVRQIAIRRLETARRIAALLQAELAEDQPRDQQA